MTLDPKKPVSLALWESPEVRTRVPHTAASWLGAHVVRPVWLWRRELVCVVVPALVGALAWTAVGLVASEPAWLVAGVEASYIGAVIVVLVTPVRRAVRHWLWGGRLRRRWDRACRFANVQSSSVRVPRVRAVDPVPAGTRLRVTMPRGLSTEDLDSGAERIAVVLDVREVRVHRDPARARSPLVHVVDRDPFRDACGPRVIRSELTDAPRWSLRDGVAVGVDEMGDSAILGLLGRNLLIGGEPEAGKSVAMGSSLAAAALDPDVAIYGLDAKQVELSLWEPVMNNVAYNNVDDAIGLLRHLIDEMNFRYHLMREMGVREAPESWAPVLLAIDELRFYTAHEDRKLRAEFNSLLVDYVARGRAAGMPSVAATQKPSSDVVPTSIRDLFAYRWALRCTTRDASDTILGSGWSSEGYSTSVVDAADRGVGLLLAEGGLPQWTKSAMLDDDEIQSIVSRARVLRKGV